MIVGFLALLLVLTPLRVVSEFRFNIPLSTAVPRAAQLGMIILSEITIAAFASLLRLAASNDENQKHLEILRREKVEAELKFLKGQISPHFLFNSINNIYGLVLTGSETAPDALLKLSELLRYSLYDCNEKVAVGTEVQAIKTYSSLFALRSSNNMDIQWNVRISNNEKKIEPMVLMPLVENIFKHSGLGVRPEAQAVVNIFSDENWLSMSTWNTINTQRANSGSGGIGIENIARRLKQLFPDDHEFVTGQVKDGFAIKLKMPLS